MLLRYKTYLSLMEALKKYAKERKYKRLYDVASRQNEIYNHFTWKFTYFTAENAIGDIKGFWVPPEKKREARKQFRQFMNT